MLQQHSLNRRCIHIFKILCGIRSTAPRRSISTSVSSDLDLDVATKEAPQLELQPRIVPAIRNALFEKRILQKQRQHQTSHEDIGQRLKRIKSRQELLYAIQENVVSHEDGLRLCTVYPELISALKRCWHHSTEIEALNDANAIIARLKCMGVALPEQLLEFFMIEAIRRGSPAAVMAYVSTMKSRNEGNSRQWLPITTLLTEFIDLEPHRRTFQGWDGKRKEQEWLCIFQILFSEWDKMLEALQDGTDSHLNDILNINFNKFVRVFLLLGGNKLAWQVAKMYYHRCGPIHDENWILLLDHPDYIGGWLPALVRQHDDRLQLLQQKTFEILSARPELIKEWTPEMTEPVLVALERHLIRIESRMHIRWSGGENGFHTCKDDISLEVAHHK